MSLPDTEGVVLITFIDFLTADAISTLVPPISAFKRAIVLIAPAAKLLALPPPTR